MLFVNSPERPDNLINLTTERQRRDVDGDKCLRRALAAVAEYNRRLEIAGSPLSVGDPIEHLRGPLTKELEARRDVIKRWIADWIEARLAKVRQIEGDSASREVTEAIGSRFYGVEDLGRLWPIDIGRIGLASWSSSDLPDAFPEGTLANVRVAARGALPEWLTSLPGFTAEQAILQEEHVSAFEEVLEDWMGKKSDIGYRFVSSFGAEELGRADWQSQAGVYRQWTLQSSAR